MIWLYIAMVAWGVLLHVAAHKGGEKRYDSVVKAETQVPWMLPVNFTAVMFWLAGATLTIYETGRIYGGL